MNRKEADSAGEAEWQAGERSSRPGSLEIFRAESERLRRIVAGMGLGADDAEDVLQDVLVQAMRHLGRCRTREAAVRWLIRVTVNRSLTEHRRRRSFRKHACEVRDRQLRIRANPGGAEQTAIATEELEVVRRSLKGLDKCLLGPIVLRYFCDLSSQQIGHVLDMSPSTVRSRLREARMILAKRLMERGIEP